jgi:hypothetical protein
MFALKVHEDFATQAVTENNRVVSPFIHRVDAPLYLQSPGAGVVMISLRQELELNLIPGSRCHILQLAFGDFASEYLQMHVMVKDFAL